MKIVIPGGSGQVGTILARHFHAGGHDVVVLSRTPRTAPWRFVPWDARSEGPWESELDGADVVINLTGRSVNCRYTAANRTAILNSRVESTRAVGAAIARTARPPRVWLQMSTATIYAHRLDSANDEPTGLIGGTESNVPSSWHFSIEVAKAWEAAQAEFAHHGTRSVALRSAMTMSPDRGGVFRVLLSLVEMRLGGRAGSGQQFVSWIHELDFIHAIEWIIARDEFHGPVNLCSPNPLSNADVMAALRRAAGVRFGLPATATMIEPGAWIMRTESELLLKSRRVVPERLLRSGFTFQYPNWPDAARDLVRKSRDPAASPAN
jgi:uncharacterized protein